MNITTACQSRGITLTLAGDAIRWTAPPGVMTDADIRLLREHKAIVMETLRGQGGDHPPGGTTPSPGATAEPGIFPTPGTTPKIPGTDEAFTPSPATGFTPGTTHQAFSMGGKWHITIDASTTAKLPVGVAAIKASHFFQCRVQAFLAVYGGTMEDAERVVLDRLQTDGVTCRRFWGRSEHQSPWTADRQRNCHANLDGHPPGLGSSPGGESRGSLRTPAYSQ